MNKVYIVQEEWNIFGDTGLEILKIFKSQEDAEKFCTKRAEESYEEFSKDYEVELNKLNIFGYDISTKDSEVYYSTWVSEYEVH